MIDAVVGHARLREVVGPDLLGAVARTDQGPALCGVLFVFFPLLCFEEPGAQNLEGLFLVLPLAAALLALDLDPGGQVGDLHRRVGGVDVLPARPARPGGLDVQLLRLELDVDVLGFRHHRHRHGGGMDAALGLGARDPLHPVHAALILQAPEDLVAGHLENHLLESTHLRETAVELLPLPPPVLRITLVHPHQVDCEQRGLVAPGPGPDLDQGVAFLGGILRQQGVLELFLEPRQFLFQPGNLLRGHLCNLGILVPGQFPVLLEIPAGRLVVLPQIHQLLQASMLPHHFGRGPRVIEEVRGRNESFQLGQPLPALLDQGTKFHERREGRGPRRGSQVAWRNPGQYSELKIVRFEPIYPPPQGPEPRSVIGNTPDFGSVILGSSPSGAATYN